MRLWGLPPRLLPQTPGRGRRLGPCRVPGRSRLMPTAGHCTGSREGIGLGAWEGLARDHAAPACQVFGAEVRALLPCRLHQAEHVPSVFLQHFGRVLSGPVPRVAHRAEGVTSEAHVAFFCPLVQPPFVASWDPPRPGWAASGLTQEGSTPCMSLLCPHPPPQSIYGPWVEAGPCL